MTLGRYNLAGRNLSSSWSMITQKPNSKGPTRTFGRPESAAGTSPLVQKLLPDGPGEKADQRVLLQRVVQKLLEVVHLRGDFQAQLTLKDRVNGKNCEKNTPTFQAVVSQNLAIHSTGREPPLACHSKPPTFLSPDAPPLQPICHTAGYSKQVASFTAGGHAKY